MTALEGVSSSPFGHVITKPERKVKTVSAERMSLCSAYAYAVIVMHLKTNTTCRTQPRDARSQLLSMLC
ncbi:unnamed protein product [Colias eurytheme]|nr:unnamed protein product [Colias eurytheme]